MIPDTVISELPVSPSAAQPEKAILLFLTFLTLKSHNSWTSFSSSCARSSFNPIHSRDTRQSWHARKTQQARRPFLACIEMLRNKKGVSVSPGTLHTHSGAGRGCLRLASHPNPTSTWHRHSTVTSVTGLHLQYFQPALLSSPLTAWSCFQWRSSKIKFQENNMQFHSSIALCYSLGNYCTGA